MDQRERKMKGIKSVKEIQAKPDVVATPTEGINTAWVRSTFMVPRPTHDRLREMAFVKKVSVQKLYQEMADAWLKLNNEPGFYPEGWRDVTKRAKIEEEESE
jgi:hypothetical protein